MALRRDRAVTLLTVLCLGLALMASLVVFHHLRHPTPPPQDVLLGWLVGGEAAAIAAVALLLLGSAHSSVSPKEPPSPTE